MSIFNAQRKWSCFSLRRSLLAFAITIGAAIMGGPTLFEDEDLKALLEGGSEEAVHAAATLNGFTNQIVDDTTRPPPIEAKPCSVHATYLNREEIGPPYRPARQEVVPSLHEFTCRWAVGNELSIDSTQLPKYVRPVGDSLRLADDALAYGVTMIPRKEGPTHDPSVLYFVSEVGDSLYYKEIERARPLAFSPSRVHVRSLRPLEVSKAKAQYIWLEHALIRESRADSTVTLVEWRANVFTYDGRRGVRHLKMVPIRYEERKGERVLGVRQLDVRLPQAGIMEVEERLQKGAHVTKGMDWHHRLGRHVIDPKAATRELEEEE